MSSPISSFKAVMEDMKARPNRNTMEGMIFNGELQNVSFVVVTFSLHAIN